MPTFVAAVGIGWFAALLLAVSLCAVAKRSDSTVERIRKNDGWPGPEGFESREPVLATAPR
jgi:hypothetical protein